MADSGFVKCCHRIAFDGQPAQTTTAVCKRVLDLANLKEFSWGSVQMDACMACGGETSPSSNFFNSVLASLLFDVGREILDRGGIPDCSQSRAESIKKFATAGLRCHVPIKPRVVRTSGTPTRSQESIECDVVVNLTGDLSLSQESLKSLLNQRGCKPKIHLVCREQVSQQFSRRELSDSEFFVHTSEAALSEIEAIHLVVPKSVSEFIAIHTPESISQPDRFSSAVQALLRHQGEVFGSAIMNGQGVTPAVEPTTRFRRTIPVETLVFRRSSFLDSGGVGLLESEHDLDLLIRFLFEQRTFVLSDEVTVERCKALQLAPVPEIQTPEYKLVENRLNHLALGFPQQRAACDVVLPFRDQLEFVEEAVDSILKQENCDITLHLIDDASRQSTSEFFDRLKTHSNIRFYRNIENLGQYTSFNNAMKYCETEFVAVQDGDDISFPDRISTAVNSLKLAGADIFSASLEMFGDNIERKSDVRNTDRQMRPVLPGTRKYSRFPEKSSTHFAINGTVVMRSALFRELGGFADYGSAIQNRGGLDTEFYLRAYCSKRARFFISRHLAGKYRRHEASATQNSVTGFGSQTRIKNREEALRRRELFSKTRFEPSDFGALGRYQHLTQPVE